ncbi:glycosyltransferase [Mycobacterium vicinigordonae]|uniref:Glycosyltransferase n=1 Tax=Mycobacterium vicinigordonae TaxID=1719132 RepID=A0A7D6E2G3_9MYCO|nr:glycosyltransferase [Mycobacterium vicinigordonae]
MGARVGAGLGEFCAALASQRHSVTVYPRQLDQFPPATEHPYRVMPAAVGPTGHVTPLDALPYISAWAALLDRAWSSNPPDIVHAFGWLGGLAAQLAARRNELRVVQSFYGMAATAGPTAETERVRLEPLLIRNASWVTGGSGSEVDALTRLRRKRAQLSVLSTGVDTERFSPAECRPTGSGLTRVLQLEPNAMPCSGFDKVIRFLPRLPEVELVLAQTSGADTAHSRDRAALKRLAGKLRVGDRVRFAGKVSGEELPTLLRSADVVVCTPQRAPRATTALQAMASGVVVVAAAVDALIDTVVNDVTGILVPPNKPQELFSAFKYLQTDRFPRESMGAAGRARAISRFTWDRVALDALGVYQHVTSSGSVKTKTTA